VRLKKVQAAAKPADAAPQEIQRAFRPGVPLAQDVPVNDSFTRNTSRTWTISLSLGLGITSFQPLAGPLLGVIILLTCRPCSVRAILTA
jgi:hypothetical protein